MYRASQRSNYLLHSPTFRCICQVTALNNFSPLILRSFEREKERERERRKKQKERIKSIFFEVCRLKFNN